MDYKLVVCSSEEREKYIQANLSSKVFSKNLQTIDKAIEQNKYVTFAGRNLYIIDSEEHNLVKKKVAEAVKKHRAKNLKKITENTDENQELVKDIKKILN